MPLMITFVAGLLILLGIPVTRITRDEHRIEAISFALAIGALTALMVFDLIPDILEGQTKLWFRLVLVAAGFLLLVLLDFVAPDHEAHHEHDNAGHIGIMSALAVILHNIVEGMSVYAVASSSLREGLILAFGIGLHNIPMGMLIYATIAGKKTRVKLILTSAVVLSTPLGGLLVRFLGSLLTENVEGSLVCVASGMIVYLIFMELLPHIIKSRKFLIFSVASAVGFVLVLISCLYL